MSRKQPKRRAGRLASFAIAGIFIFIVACGVGFGVASADSTDELARAGAFGFNQETHEASQGNLTGASGDLSFEDATAEPYILATTSARDISAGLAMVDSREAAEREQVAADNKAVLNRVAAEKAMQESDKRNSGVATPSEGAEGEAPQMGLDEYGLTPVDWTVGKYAFVAEWSERIDAYLAKTPLEGYGTTFAEAAWKNGVDPRWSPAISNTESGNGRHCFLPHNAWGWGDDAWPSWEAAINEHVAGLAKGYGYSVTVDAAQKYCPPNSAHWYKNTLSQMALI